MLIMENFKKIIKRILRVVGITLISIVCIVLAYVLYVFFSYKRIDDHQVLNVCKAMAGDSIEKASVGNEYTIVSYNIGFGAYDPRFTFFMDGGKSSWATSKESVQRLVTGAGELAQSFDPDFVLFQEIDFDSTRSYHVNQLDMLRRMFAEYDNTLGVNYDSPFLLYPFNQPHGTSRAGVGTFSRYNIEDAERRSLPIANNFSKFVDLDRCFTVNRIPVSNGKYLVLINLHMSAYGSSPSVREGQTGLLKEVLEKEYSEGNYVIAGGDFNHDLKLTEDTQTYSWAHFYDRNLLPEHFTFAMDQLPSEEKYALSNSCRDSGVVYDPETTYTVTLDGFIVSDNIEMTYYTNNAGGFLYSDHEPVIMKFKLKL